MLKVTLIEFILRGIPESFVIVWGIYVISRQSINKLKYVLCSTLVASVIYLVRLLPIHAGINTIISSIFIAFCMVTIGIPLLKAIYGIIITTLLLLIGELINVLIFNIFNINIDIAFKNPSMKCVLMLPSLIFLILTIMLIRFLLNKWDASKRVCT